MENPLNRSRDRLADRNFGARTAERGKSGVNRLLRRGSATRKLATLQPRCQMNRIQ